MSKRHKNKNKETGVTLPQLPDGSEQTEDNQEQETSVEESEAEDTDETSEEESSDDEAESQSEETENAEVSQTEQSEQSEAEEVVAPDASENEVESSEVEQKPAEQTPPEPKVEQPKKVEIKEKIMSDKILAGGRSITARRTNGPVVHTESGKRLIKLFDEYAALMSKKTNDEKEIRDRAQKLVDLYNASCPVRATDITTSTDLVRVVFDKIMEYWGDVFKDANMFASDYLSVNAKKDPAYTDRVTMFFTAFFQMVEAAISKEPRPVMFNYRQLSDMIKNDNIAKSMMRIRDSLNQRNGYEEVTKKL